MSTLRERLKAAKFHSEIVEVEGAEVEVRELSAGEKYAYAEQAEAFNKKGVGLANLLRTLIADTAYDPETGEKVFPGQHRNEINDIPGHVEEALRDTALRINGLEKAARAAAKNGSGAADESSTA